MKIRNFMFDLHKLCRFASQERGAKEAGTNNSKPLIASNSEVDRWIKQGSVVFNGERVLPDEELYFPIISLVLHPKSQHRVTLV